MSDTRTIEEILQTEKIFVSTTVGVSMRPMLRDRKDTIVVKPYSGRLKKYDIPLYKRGTDYVLHRIVEVLPDSYVICGDNCECKEYGITDAEILGVLTECYRGAKKLDMNGRAYKYYVRLWCLLYPLRALYKRLRRQLGNVCRVIKKGKK